MWSKTSLILALFVCSACSPAVSNEEEETIDKNLTTREITKTRIDKNELAVFLSLFPVVSSFEFNELLFEKHEGGQGETIPIQTDINILKTEHEGYDGSNTFTPEAFNYAIAKFEVLPNSIWGLVVLNHELGTDGRNQTYRIYTINKIGKIVHTQTVAASLGWQGGMINETGSLEKVNNQYEIKTVSVVAEWGEKEALIYPYRGKQNHYIVEQAGMIHDASSHCFLIPDNPVATEGLVFEGIALIENRVNKTKIPSDWLQASKTQNILTWKDSQGENYLLFALRDRKEESNLAFAGKEAERTLHACHYTIKEGKIAKQWEMNDYTPVCEFDLFTDFLYKSVSLTDLDKDGIAEVGFLYTLGCISDMSSVSLKMMLYENGEKYALRGDSRIAYEVDHDIRKEPMYQVDNAFDKAPKEFLAFAKKHWAKHDVVY